MVETGTTPVTSERELLERITELQKSDKQEADRLSALWNKMRSARLTGESFGWDPWAAQAPTFVQEEAAELFLAAKDSEELLGAVQNLQKAGLYNSDLALPMPTYALTKNVPLVMTPEGKPTEARSTKLFEYLPGLSVPRFCLAGLLKMLGKPIRAARLVGYVPMGNISDELAASYGIPLPQTQLDQQDIHQNYFGSLKAWQRAQVEKRLIQWADEQDMIPVAAPPRGITNGLGLAKIVVTLVDREIVEEICLDFNSEGEEVGRKNLHYMQVLFSNGDVRFREETVEKDGEEKQVRVGLPDYRLGLYRAADADTMSPISELLGLGPWESDGSGLMFSTEPDVQAIKKEVLEAESLYITQEEAEKRAAVRDYNRGLEVQFRGTSLLQEDGEDDVIMFLAKGTLKALDLKQIERALVRYEEQLAELLIQHDEARENDAPNTGAYGQAVFSFQKRYVKAYVTLMDIAEEVRKGHTVSLIVQDDQIKVGSRFAHTGSGFQPFAMIGTYLKGSDEWFYHVDGENHEERVLLMYHDENGNCIGASSLAGDHDAVWAGRKKPRTYLVSGNSQVLQFASAKTAKGLGKNVLEQVKTLAENLTTTTGIAAIISEYEHETRADAEKSDSKDNSKSKVIETSELDLLREGLRSGLITMTAKGIEQMSSGEKVEPGNVRMPAPMKTRLDRLVAARMASILRSFGVQLPGHHHTTCENSVATNRALWGLDNGGWKTNEGLTTHDYTASWYGSNDPEYPFMDASTCYVNKRITNLVNADDDGDITWGISTHITLENGRVVKAVMFGRYPMVDSPVIWLLPAGTPTPWDAVTEQEDNAFRMILEALAPVVPEYADLFGDEIVIAECDNLLRLSPEGAKSGIAKKKLVGPVNMASAMATIRRKWALNSTGSLTRRLERFAVLIAETERAIEQGWYWLGGERVQINTLRWELAREDYIERARRTMELLELQLTGFKYDVELYRPPSLSLGQDDPFGHEDDAAVIAAIPVDYHGTIRTLRVVAKRDGNQKYSKDTSLEQLVNRPEAPFPGIGKEAAILNFVVKGYKGKESWQGGAGREIVHNLNAIHTDVTPYITELKKLLEEEHGSLDNIEATDIYQARELSNNFRIWREYWKEVLGEVNQRIDDEAAATRMREYVGHAGEAIRYRMNIIAKNASVTALRLALYNHWNGEHIKIEQEVANGTLSPERALERRRNSAAALAMIEGRMSEIFPFSELKIRVVDKRTNAVRAISKGVDLPGMIGDVVQFDEVLSSTIEDTNHASGGTVNVLVGRIGSEHFVLWPADGEDLSIVPTSANLMITKLNHRRVVVRWS